MVVGVGLVGRRVAEAARRRTGTLHSDTELPRVSWGVSGGLSHALDEAVSRLRESRPRPSTLRLFWCAGRAGFSSTPAECEAELRSFDTILRWAENRRSEQEVEFHLTSSAGGLHEGKVLVSDPKDVCTKRPYAALKLAQEEALQASAVRARFIYRLSSVYDLPEPGRRLGLISTLVLNALRRRPTLITAHAATQRDFIFAGDVGTFIASDGKPSQAGPSYLVSGRPLSIWALQLALERHLLRRVAVVYSTGKDNFESTTFLPALRPTQWSISSVESNLAKIVAAAQTYSKRA